MRLPCLLLFASMLLMAGPAATAPKDEAAKESEKLKGRWYVLSYEVNGKEIPSDQIKRFESNLFDFEKVNVIANGKERESTFTLDPSAKPKAIDLVWNNKVTVGIYEIEGDRMKLCLAPEGEKKRPKEFVSKERSELRLIGLRRPKEKE